MKALRLAVLPLACLTAGIVLAQSPVTSISYKDFTQSLLRPKNGHKGFPTFNFLGSRKGKPCGAVGSMSYNNGEPASNLHLVVLKAGQYGEWYNGGSVITTQDKITKKYLDNTGTQVLYQVQRTDMDDCMNGRTTLYMRTKTPDGSIADASYLHLRVGKNPGCTNPNIRTERAACDNLSFVYAETQEFRNVAAALLAQTPAWKNLGYRLKEERSYGCDFIVGAKPSFRCGWDVSDDPEGDSGDVAYGIYTVKDGMPGSVIRTCTGDKYDGGDDCGLDE
jgi:hypothetical protein